MYPAVGVDDILLLVGDAVNGVPEEFRGGEQDRGADQYYHRELVMEAEHRALINTLPPRQVLLQSSQVLNGRHLAPAVQALPLPDNILPHSRASYCWTKKSSVAGSLTPLLSTLRAEASSTLTSGHLKVAIHAFSALLSNICKHFQSFKDV